MAGQNARAISVAKGRRRCYGRGARGQGELADRFVSFLAIAVIVVLAASIAFLLVRHFRAQFGEFRRAYNSVLETGIMPGTWQIRL